MTTAVRTVRRERALERGCRVGADRADVDGMKITTKTRRHEKEYLFFLSSCLRGYDPIYQSNFTPNRASRGAMIVTGSRNVEPEPHVMLAAGFAFVRL